jgi:cytidyltransferase-like protein
MSDKEQKKSREIYKQDEYKHIVSCIHKFSKLLTENGIKHWLDYGTLLHAYRDGALNSPGVTATGTSNDDDLLNDDDFDICLLQTDYDKVKQLCKDNNIDAVVMAPNQLLRFAPKELAQLDNNNDWPDRSFGKYDPWLDLFFWHDNPTENLLVDHVDNQPDVNSDAYKIVVDTIKTLPKSSLFNWATDNRSLFKYYWITKKYFIQELDTLELYGYKFPIPRYIERHLESRYGPQWKTPMTKGLYVTKFYDKDPLKHFDIFTEDEITVFIEGVWDLFHQGHVELLKRAHSIYDKVIVGVAPDDLVIKNKRQPIIPYVDRVKMLEACKYVDEIYHNAPAWNITQELLDDCGADYSLHSVEDPNNYVAELTEAGHGELVKKGKVHFLSYTNYHSTDIINIIKERFNLT